MARYENFSWDLPPLEGGHARDGVVTNALLMDIREELRKLNRLLGCPNFIDVPNLLRGIKANTSKRRKPRKRVR